MDSNDLINALYHLQGSGTLQELAREVGTAMAQELRRLQKDDAEALLPPLARALLRQTAPTKDERSKDWGFCPSCHVVRPGHLPRCSEKQGE